MHSINRKCSQQKKSFFSFMCVYVCIQDCVYVRGFLCVCVYSCIWRLGIILGEEAVTPQLLSTLFYFEKESLFCLEVTIRLGWMASEL